MADFERLDGTTSPVAGAAILHDRIGDAAFPDADAAQELSEFETTRSPAVARMLQWTISARSPGA
jgi:hypothetical protein